MSKLEQKGILVKRKKSKTNFYKPLLSRKQATENHLKYLIENFFDDDPEVLIMFVFQHFYEMQGSVVTLLLKRLSTLSRVAA